MNTKTLLRKVEAIKSAHAKEKKRRLKRGENPRWIGQPFPMVFKIRTLTFANSSKSCELQLNGDGTWYGHSYRWYDLVKTIKGHVVLNTYVYSVQTSKHISKVRKVFSQLGVKYLAVEAPRGLQSLEEAKKHSAMEYGRAVVRQKYSRDKTKREVSSLPYTKNLEKIGVKVSDTLLKNSIELAELERKNRLERAKMLKQRRAEYLAKREAERLEREKAITPELSIIQGG